MRGSTGRTVGTGSADETLPAAEGTVAVRPHPDAKPPEVAHGSKDDRGLGARRGAGRSRVVRNADLDDRAAGCPQLDQELGREERTAGLDADAVEPLAPEELAGAVDIANAEAEEDPIGEAVRPCVERPHEWIRPLDPEADDRVGAVGSSHPIDQPAEILDPELAITVGEGDVLVVRGSKPAAERGAVAEVRR